MGTRRDAEMAIIEALRRYGVAATAVGQAFSSHHALQQSDLQALTAIMDADRAGSPLTPTALRAHLGLSSGGTTYVIDRLERAGHVRREPNPADRRAVHLRYTAAGMSTALAFFGPLGERTTAMLGQFEDGELAVVDRFVTGAVEAMHAHLASLGHLAAPASPEPHPGERREPVRPT